MKYVYIAGPYTSSAGHDHRGYHEIERHIAKAREASVWLAERGIGLFCPHMNFAHNEVIVPSVPLSFWYEMSLHFLKACDAILMLPGWEESKGAREELEEAEERGKPVFYFSLPSSLARLARWVEGGGL